MTAAPLEGRLGDGLTALVAGEWEDARRAFEDVVAVSDDPEALDGLGRALWWLRDPRGAVVHRERAYAGFRRAGEVHRAARIALWLSREYGQVWGNEAAANGWLARGERLLASASPGSDQGWLDLARSERAGDPGEAAAYARSALAVKGARSSTTSPTPSPPTSAATPSQCSPDPRRGHLNAYLNSHVLQRFLREELSADPAATHP